MGATLKITEEVFDQTKKLLSTNLFDRKQIGEMVGISKASVDQINIYASLAELRAAQKAAWELAQQRRKEKEERERAAAEAFQKALSEETTQPEDENSIIKSLDGPELKMDIIIEKLDTLIGLLKEVRIAQTAQPKSTEPSSLGPFFDKAPTLNEKPF